MRGICEGVEHHLWSSDSRPAYRGIRTLRSSKPIPRCTAVRAEGGWLLTEESKVKSRWASYFEWLYQDDPPAVDLDVRGVTIHVADPPINCDPPSFVETQAVVNRLKWGEPSPPPNSNNNPSPPLSAPPSSPRAMLCPLEAFIPPPFTLAPFQGAPVDVYKGVIRTIPSP